MVVTQGDSNRIPVHGAIPRRCSRMQSRTHPYAILRPAAAQDVDSIGQLAEVAGLFPASLLPGMIADNLAGSDGQVWRVVKVAGRVSGFAFAESERLTDRTWNLRAIGVDPADRRQGIGDLAPCGRRNRPARPGRAPCADRDHGRRRSGGRPRLVPCARLRGGGSHPRLLGGWSREGRLLQAALARQSSAPSIQDKDRIQGAHPLAKSAQGRARHRHSARKRTLAQPA